MVSQLWLLHGAPWFTWMCFAYVPFRTLLLSALLDR